MSKRSQLANALYEMLQQKGRELSAEAVAAYLIEERQVKDIASLMRDIQAIRLKRDGVLEVVITSAHEIDDQIEALIKSLFDAKRVIIHKQTDSSLLGGVRVQAQNQELDLSVRARLQRLKAGV